MGEANPSGPRSSAEIFPSRRSKYAQSSPRQQQKQQLRLLRQRIALKRSKGHKLTAVEAHLARRMRRLERCLLGPTSLVVLGEIGRNILRPMPIVLLAVLVLAAEGSTVAWLSTPQDNQGQNSARADRAPAIPEYSRLTAIAAELNTRESNSSYQLAQLGLDTEEASDPAIAPVELALSKMSAHSGGLAGFLSEQVKNVSALLPQKSQARDSSNNAEAYDNKYPGLIQFISGVIAVFCPSELDSGKIARHIVEISLRENVDPVFVASVIAVESSFRSSARSRVGAMGLMQVRPSTAKSIRSQNSPGQAALALTDPEQNIELGIAYLKYLGRRYNGNLRLALAAYNWGPTNLSKALKAGDRIPGSVQKYAAKIIEKTERWHTHYGTASAQALEMEQAS